MNHNLSKESEKSYRPYEKQPETPYGQYAQFDFGERWMNTSQGIPLKVYFFAMSLSRSRYKFIYFSRTPFTTDLAVYAHKLAFEYFSGVPRNVVKYVKYNFLRDREFTSIEQLNEEVQAWLKRTANGMEHHGIHRIPSVEFELERPHLMPYREVPTIPSPKLLTRVM